MTKMSQLPSDTAPTITDYVATVDVETGATKRVLLSDLLPLATAQSVVAAGVSIQTAYTLTSAVDTTATVIPADDTIPTSSEGKEFMTCVITPKASTNILVIHAVVWLTSTQSANNMIAALFQDAGAAAIDVGWGYNAAASIPVQVSVLTAVVAGTTSATTFRVRGGGSAAGTTTFNGSAGARFFGAITKSAMTITEYKV